MRQLDSAGNVLSLTEFDNGCPTYAVQTASGGFIGGGLNYPEHPYHDYAFKLNEAGIFEWKYDIPWYVDTLYNDQLFISISKEMPDGNVIVIGYFPGKPWGSYYGMVSKLNADGEPYWERIYTSTASTEFDNRLHDIEFTDDGGFAITGAAYSEDLTEDQNFWLLKLDSMGCLIPGCDTLFTSVMELPYDKAGILVYPHPVTTEAIVQITLNDIADINNLVCEISDMSGRIIKQLAVENLHYAVPKLRDGNKITFPFRRENLNAGIYMMHIYDDGRTIGTIKL